MEISSETFPEIPLDFRAPPPSPIANASSCRSSIVNDDELSEFLQHSLRIPDLVLPDRIFPKETLLRNPPEIDFPSLFSSEIDSITKVLESISGIGCFQIVNHGISSDLIRSGTSCAAGIFRLSTESKEILLRSPEKRYGFEDYFDEEEMQKNEEFVWCEDEGLKSVMEGIWPQGYLNFSQKMEILSLKIEKIARKLLEVLLKNAQGTSSKGQELVGLICCLCKHYRNSLVSQLDSSIKSDIFRMLIRGSDYSHALCLHICDGSSEFHVYSKKGWISFSPNKDAIVITAGDQIQAWSAGQYKSVIGRPIFKVENEDYISMAFLYSPSAITQRFQGNKEKTISLRQQVMLALFLTLIYNFLLFIYKKF